MKDLVPKMYKYNFLLQVGTGGQIQKVRTDESSFNNFVLALSADYDIKFDERVIYDGSVEDTIGFYKIVLVDVSYIDDSGHKVYIGSYNQNFYYMVA